MKFRKQMIGNRSYFPNSHKIILVSYYMIRVKVDVH